MQKNYHYDSPALWLLTHAAGLDFTELYSLVNVLVTLIDSDELQNIFQKEMAADGYFEELV